MTNQYTQGIQLTLFPDFAARTCREITVTLSALAETIRRTTAAEKSALPWLKLATFGTARTGQGSLRNNNNVTAITGIEADYDLGEMSVDDATLRLDMYGIAAMVYTSPSHKPECPRWRVLCPVSAPLPPERRGELIARLNAVMGGKLSRESHTLSQAYYFGSVNSNPAHVVELVDGTPIDLCAGLPEPTYPERALVLATAALPPIEPGTPPDARAVQALTAAAALFQNAEQIAHGRHPTLLAATIMVAPFVKAGLISYEDCHDELELALSGAGRDATYGEVGRALRGAIETCRPYQVPTEGAEFTGLPAPAVADEPSVTVLEITEDAASRSMARDLHNRLMHDHTMSRWYVFQTGTGWVMDERDHAFDTARRYLDLAREQWGHKASEKAATMGFAASVLRGCSADPLMSSVSADWDADAAILGVPGGHVDLRTGEVCSARPDVLQRRRTAVKPSADACPIWLAFLDQATGGDAEFIAWLQRLCGYVLTGDMREEMFAFFYGPGGNGKGVFLGTLSAILGTYAYQAPAELFKSTSKLNPEYQLARLQGVRALLVSETERGSILAESLVKELTGNEGLINARHPRGRPFEFRSTAKLIVVGNHAPAIHGRNAAMERRLRVVPFKRTPARPDPDLKDRLVPEYGAILGWMIAGAVSWYSRRLGMCDAIATASSDYFDEQDDIAQWIGERCDTSNVQIRTSATDLLADFNAWMRARGEQSTDAKAFKESLSRYPQYAFRRVEAGSVYCGLMLRANIADDLHALMS